MNTTPANVNNFLYQPQSSDYVDEMYTFWLQCLSVGHTVLVLARQGATPRILPLLEKLEMNVVKHKEQLQRLIIMYFNNIEGVIGKLLELHDWALRPSIIVIDFIGFITASTQLSRTTPQIVAPAASQVAAPAVPQAVDAPAAPQLVPVPLLRVMCHCIATLFNLTAALGTHKLRQTAAADNGSESKINKFCSVVLLQPHGTALSAEQLALIIALYYYDDTAYDEFEQLRNKIKEL